MESLSALMEQHNKAIRDAAIITVKRKEAVTPAVKAPYIMKHQSTCDYFK